MAKCTATLLISRHGCLLHDIIEGEMVGTKKSVPDMTFNVFVGTLSLTQSVSHCRNCYLEVEPIYSRKI